MWQKTVVLWPFSGPADPCCPNPLFSVFGCHLLQHLSFCWPLLHYVLPTAPPTGHLFSYWLPNHLFHCTIILSMQFILLGLPWIWQEQDTLKCQQLFIFFFIVPPCVFKSTQFTHQQMHYLLTWPKVLNLCVLCAVQSETLTLHCTQHTRHSTLSLCTAHNTHAALRHAATSSNIYNDVILPGVLT